MISSILIENRDHLENISILQLAPFCDLHHLKGRHEDRRTSTYTVPGGYHEANNHSSRLHIFTTHFDLTTHSLNQRKSYRSLSTHVPPLPLPSSNCIMTFTHFTFTEIFFKNRSIHKYFLVALNSIPLTVFDKRT